MKKSILRILTVVLMAACMMIGSTVAFSQTAVSHDEGVNFNYVSTSVVLPQGMNISQLRRMRIGDDLGFFMNDGRGGAIAIFAQRNRDTHGSYETFGLIDQNGEIVLDAKYLRLGHFDFDSGLAPVAVREYRDGRMATQYVGFINTMGELTLPLARTIEFHGNMYRLADMTSFSEGAAFVQYVNLLPARHEDNNGLQQFGRYINPSGNPIFDDDIIFRPRMGGMVANGMFISSPINFNTTTNRQGQTRTTWREESAWYAFRLHNSVGITAFRIFGGGTSISTFGGRRVSFASGYFYYVDKGYYVFVSTSGEQIRTPIPAERRDTVLGNNGTFQGDFFRATHRTRDGSTSVSTINFYDTRGALLLSSSGNDDIRFMDYAEGFFTVRVRQPDGGFSMGFATLEDARNARTGNCLTISAIYDEVRPFSEGLAAVRIGNLWGFIDSSGQSAIPIVYRAESNGNSPPQFLSGFAFVRDRGGNYVVLRNPLTLSTANGFTYSSFFERFNGFIMPVQPMMRSGMNEFRGWTPGAVVGTLRDSVNGRGFHSGIDYLWDARHSDGLPIGAPVFAVADGEVTFAAYLGVGGFIEIKHTGRFRIEQYEDFYSVDGAEDTEIIFSAYTHLKNMQVSVGDTVYAGQIIGYVGGAGNSHLHFEIRSADRIASNDGSMVGRSTSYWVLPNYRTLEDMFRLGIRRFQDVTNLGTQPSD